MSLLLIALGLTLITSTNGQGSGGVTTVTTQATATSLSTYTATSLATALQTSVMNSTTLTVYSWWTSCSFWATPFNAQLGDEVVGTLSSPGSDFNLDFYLMSQAQLARVQMTICNPVAAPVWSSILHYKVASSRTIDWTPTFQGGEFYFVVVNFNPYNVASTFSGYVKTYGAVTQLSYGTVTSEVVQAQTLTLTQNPTIPSQGSQAQPQNSTQNSPISNLQTTALILVLVLAIVLIGAFLGLKGRKRHQ